MTTSRPHNTWISCAKGLAILLMVVGHSGAPVSLVSYIYNFHMPLFFFVSGYLFNTRHLQNGKQYLSKKFKTLYIPFVKWSLIFLLFHNLLASINVYDSAYILSDFKSKVIGVVTMTDSEQLLGGFWFLKQLLYTSIIAWIILFLIYRHPERIRITLPITILVTLGFAVFYSYSSVKIPTISTVTLLATAFFLTGHLFCTYDIFSRLSNIYRGAFW